MTRPLPVTYEWSTLAGVTRCSRSRLHWGRIQWAVACVIYSGPVSWVSRLAFWASIGSSRIYHLPAIARAVVLSLTDPVSCDSAPGVGLQLRVSRTQNEKSPGNCLQGLFLETELCDSIAHARACNVVCTTIPALVQASDIGIYPTLSPQCSA